MSSACTHEFLYMIPDWTVFHILSGHVSAEDELEDEVIPDAAVEEEEDEEEEDEVVVDDPQASDTVSVAVILAWLMIIVSDS